MFNKFECTKNLKVNHGFMGYYIAFYAGKTYDTIPEDNNGITLRNERGREHNLSHTYWPLYFNEIDDLDFNIL